MAIRIFKILSDTAAEQALKHYCIDATTQSINISVSTRRHNWGAHSTLTMHLKM